MKDKIPLLVTLASIPTEINIDKKHEVPAEINKRKISDEHEPF